MDFSKVSILQGYKLIPVKMLSTWFNSAGSTSCCHSLSTGHSVQVSNSAHVKYSLRSDAEVALFAGWWFTRNQICTLFLYCNQEKKKEIQPQKHKLWQQTAGRKVNRSIMNCEIFLPLPCNIKRHQQNDGGNGEEWIIYSHLEAELNAWGHFLNRKLSGLISSKAIPSKVSAN